MHILSGIFIASALLLTPDSELKDEARELFFSGEEEEALAIYSEIVDDHPDDVEVIWQTAMLYARVGNRLEDHEEREDHFARAEYYAEQALDLDSGNANAHFTYSVVQARIANHASTEESLAKSEKIRSHSQKALEIDPEHEGALHVLGMWHQRIANLSFAERAIVNTLFGGVPDGASNEKAEQYLSKAAEQDPEMILYQLDLAKFYTEQGNDTKARRILQDLQDLEPRFKEDAERIEEAGNMLASL